MFSEPVPLSVILAPIAAVGVVFLALLGFIKTSVKE